MKKFVFALIAFLFVSVAFASPPEIETKEKFETELSGLHECSVSLEKDFVANFIFAENYAEKNYSVNHVDFSFTVPDIQKINIYGIFVDILYNLPNYNYLIDYRKMCQINKYQDNLLS
jgi:hypothetical protein